MVVSLLLWCFCMAALGLPNSAAADEPDLCVVDRLASSPFSARLMQRVPSSGCFSRRVSPRGQEVHVIRLSAPRDPLRRQARRSVTLTVFSPTDGSSHSREIILVLASSTPVDWTIHGHNGFLNGTSFQIIVTKRSQVVRCDLAPYSVKSQRVRGREALLKFVMTRLQAVTSLSAVGAADTIDLTVGIDLDAPDTCDTKVKSRRPSTSLAAHVSRPVPLLGCYHSHLAGFGPRDVYVVEVATESQSFWNSRVSVNLLPTADRKSAAGNLTLILKSAVPVTWELTSENFSGDLLVLTERPVKEARLGPAVTVETRFTRLPESFTALMLFAVKYSHGPPVAYVRAAAFNELDIRLNGGPGEAAPEDLPADDATRVPPGESTASDASHPALTDGAGSASGQLRRSVSVSCSGGRLTVAVPSAAAAAVSVSLLHLEDWGCVSHRNDTHLVVSGPLTQCGTSRRQTGEYVNTVHFVAAPLPEDDEDFEGSGAGAAGDVGGSVGSASSWSWPQRTSGGSVPLSCTPPEQEDPNDDQDVTLDIDEVGASMYGLELAADPQFTRPTEPNVQLPVSDSIYIRATLFMASYLVPVVEQCWVSGAAAPASSAGSARVTLVDGACPARPSVSRLYGRDPAYRLQVTREFAALGPYYLHCRIGVCATPDSPARQHIVQCLEDPASHCSAAGVASQTSGRRLASGLQVLSRGPLFTSVPEDSSAESGEAAGRRPLPPLGVPHETVAGISIAAFLLGVLLMAGVWLIHTKIGPSKRHHFQAVPQNPGLDPVGAVSVVGNSGGSGASGNGAGGSGGGGQSANSTPNSQTPIIVSGRAAPPVGV